MRGLHDFPSLGHPVRADLRELRLVREHFALVGELLFEFGDLLRSAAPEVARDKGEERKGMSALARRVPRAASE